MSNHSSVEKYLRSSLKRKIRNKYKLKTCKTFIKKLIKSNNKDESLNMLKKVFSMIDILSKNNIIHKNKASNQKSKLSKMVNKL